jgi:hypothetical protein
MLPLVVSVSTESKVLYQANWDDMPIEKEKKQMLDICAERTA